VSLLDVSEARLVALNNEHERCDRTDRACFHARRMRPYEDADRHPQANRDARVAFTTASERPSLQRHEHLFLIQYRGVSSKYTLT
jgi:hypothetical protein